MALVAATLQNAFLRVFSDAKSNTAERVARDLAQAYHDYAQWASAGGMALPLLTGLEKVKLERLVFATLVPPKTGTSAAFTTAWANGVAAFWQAPPVQFSAPPITGMVTVAAGATPIISAGFLPFLQAPSVTPELAALTLASVLDAATRTVMVTLVLPPPASPIVVPLL